MSSKFIEGDHKQEERARVRRIIARKRHEYEDVVRMYGPGPLNHEVLTTARESAKQVIAVLETIDTHIVGGGA